MIEVMRFEPGYDHYSMRQAEDGDFVEYIDYAALEAAALALRDAWREDQENMGVLEAELGRLKAAAVPVKVPEEKNVETAYGKSDSYLDHAEGWNDCRAEMLRLNDGAEVKS